MSFVSATATTRIDSYLRVVGLPSCAVLHTLSLLMLAALTVDLWCCASGGFSQFVSNSLLSTNRRGPRQPGLTHPAAQTRFVLEVYWFLTT